MTVAHMVADWSSRSASPLKATKGPAIFSHREGYLFRTARSVSSASRTTRDRDDDEGNTKVSRIVSDGGSAIGKSPILNNNNLMKIESKQ